MFGKFLISAALVLSAAFSGGMALAAEPTVDQVYQAAQGGRYIEAQTMLDEVLKAHPTSAKAHYIQAQVYAKQGLMTKAGAALADADRLDPAAKYASPSAIQALRTQIAAPRPSLSDNRALQPAPVRAQQVQTPAPQAPRERSFPWGLLLGGLGLVAFIVWVSRMMSQRTAAMQAANGGMGAGGIQQYPGGAYGPTGGGAGYAPGYGPGYGGVAPQAPGMGSRIMGGLATGAAVGAGIVAGEAMMRHFTDNDRNANAAPAPSNDNWAAPAPSYDMGGNDFGVSDTSSWDSGGGGDGGGGSWD